MFFRIEKLKEERERYAKFRQEKQPSGFSCGSVFKGVRCDKTGEIIPAGKIIHELGLKGMRKGGAEVSTKHANFIINLGNATSSDISYLIDKIKKIVYDSRGVILEEEVEHIPNYK